MSAKITAIEFGVGVALAVLVVAVFTFASSLLWGCAPEAPPRALPPSCAGTCPAPYDPTPRGPDDTGECYCEAPQSVCPADEFVGLPCSD